MMSYMVGSWTIGERGSGEVKQDKKRKKEEKKGKNESMVSAPTRAWQMEW